MKQNYEGKILILFCSYSALVTSICAHFRQFKLFKPEFSIRCFFFKTSMMALLADGYKLCKRSKQKKYMKVIVLFTSLHYSKMSSYDENLAYVQIRMYYFTGITFSLFLNYSNTLLFWPLLLSPENSNVYRVFSFFFLFFVHICRLKSTFAVFQTQIKRVKSSDETKSIMIFFAKISLS